MPPELLVGDSSARNVVSVAVTKLILVFFPFQISPASAAAVGQCRASTSLFCWRRDARQAVAAFAAV